MDEELKEIKDLIELRITPENINSFCNKFETYIRMNKKFKENSGFLLGINGIQKVSCYKKMNQKSLDKYSYIIKHNMLLLLNHHFLNT
jgi:hypothetical protein